MLRLVAVGLLGLSVGMGGAQEPEQPTVAAQISNMLSRAGSGHSPTTDEVRAVEALPGLNDAKVATLLEPLMERALTNPDAAVRGYGLAMLVGMQSLPDAAEVAGVTGGNVPVSVPGGTKNSSLTATAGPASYKSDVAKALAPLVPAIAHELTDDDPANRLLAANALGGFTPDPPVGVYTALLEFLKRDDAIGPVGLAAVGDLLETGQLSDDKAESIVRYLRRNDQTPDARANLIEAIAARPYQNKIVDKAVVAYMDSDDATLRARVILSLPALDLPADTFADTKAAVAGLAGGGQENPQVVSAAKAVSGCWTQVKMTAGCPVY